MSLGELSTLLVWGAVTAYAIAFVAFAVDLARLADSRATPTPAPRPPESSPIQKGSLSDRQWGSLERKQVPKGLVH